MQDDWPIAGRETILLALRCPRPQRSSTETVMNINPLPDDLTALKQIISGKPADPKAMINCSLVEDFDGTALLTARCIQAAARLVPAD
jgi:hypothetical protein